MKNELNHLGQPIGYPVPNWTPPPIPVPEIVEGRYCWLEPLDVDKHSEDLFAAYSLDKDGANWSYLPYGPFEQLEDFQAWLKSNCQNDDPQFYAVLDKKSDKVMGMASYLRMNPTAGSIEVGHIHFSPLMQGSIASTECMYLMMKRAFNSGYRRYEWKCNALNEPSRRAAQRLGLSFEGVFRQSLVVKGRNRDSAWYAAIDTEWMELEKAYKTWLAPENFDEKNQQKTSLSSLTSPTLKNKG